MSYQALVFAEPADLSAESLSFGPQPIMACYDPLCGCKGNTSSGPAAQLLPNTTPRVVPPIHVVPPPVRSTLPPSLSSVASISLPFRVLSHGTTPRHFSPTTHVVARTLDSGVGLVQNRLHRSRPFSLRPIPSSNADTFMNPRAPRPAIGSNSDGLSFHHPTSEPRLHSFSST